MGTIKNFEDLEIWKMSRALFSLIWSDFAKTKEYCFRDQMTRAGISLMNNISEGFCRQSDAELRHFLNISKGSAGEIKCMYYIAEDMNLVNGEKALKRREEVQKLMNAISSLIKYLGNSK
jgi:four helix bundle protein